MISRLVLLLCFTFSNLAEAREKILECMEPVHLNDPDFVQGSELFLDIYLNGKGLDVELTRGDLEKETLFISEDVERWSLDEEGRSLSAQWPAGVRLVARQFQTRWYGEFWFSEGLKTRLLDLSPGQSLSLSCIEKGRLFLDVD